MQHIRRRLPGTIPLTHIRVLSMLNEKSCCEQICQAVCLSRRVAAKFENRADYPTGWGEFSSAFGLIEFSFSPPSQTGCGGLVYRARGVTKFAETYHEHKSVKSDKSEGKMKNTSGKLQIEIDQ